MSKDYHKIKFFVRDVCGILQTLRTFLLGRRYTLHGRFFPLMSPRTVPPPDIPRGPEYKYAQQYYYKRSSYHTVMPPVTAPVGKEDDQSSTMKFECPPTPGQVWWWDGHNYYEPVKKDKLVTCK